MRELASGVDALYLSGRGTISSDVWDRCREAREEARAADAPVPLVLGQNEFLVQGRGFGKYLMRLDHAHGVIGLTDSTALPTIRVQPRAELLHAVGPARAVAWFKEALEPAIGDLAFGAARVDLFADWQGWQPIASDRNHFVCRSKRTDTHEDDGVLTGFQFGRRSTGISARMYNKTLDAGKKGADYWPDLWGKRFDSARAVWRLEFEFGRQVLKQFSIDTPAQALAGKADLWRYGMRWLSLRQPTNDRTRSRWPVAPHWDALTDSPMASEPIGLVRAYGGKRAGSIRKLMPALTGYVASFAALSGASDTDEALDLLCAALYDDEIVRRKPFPIRIADKRRKLMLP